MGLAAGWGAAKAGHRVTVLEAGAAPGGMSAHFDFGGLSIERFYHYICKSDHTTFELLDDLDLTRRLRWRRSTMGYFMGGKLYRWGDPLSLLRFPFLGLVDKLRYGWHVYRASTRSDWSTLHVRLAGYLECAGSIGRAR